MINAQMERGTKKKTLENKEEPQKSKNESAELLNKDNDPASTKEKVPEEVEQHQQEQASRSKRKQKAQHKSESQNQDAGKQNSIDSPEKNDSNPLEETVTNSSILKQASRSKGKQKAQHKGESQNQGAGKQDSIGSPEKNDSNLLEETVTHSSVLKQASRSKGKQKGQRKGESQNKDAGKQDSIDSPVKSDSNPSEDVTHSSVLSISTVGHTQEEELVPPTYSRKQKTGMLGRNLALQMNSVALEINIPGGILYHYDVSFKFPDKRRAARKSDRRFLVTTIEEFKRKHQNVLGDPTSIVFDGLKNAITYRQLKIPSGEFEGTVEVQKEPGSNEQIEMVVKLKFVNEVPVNDVIQEYIRNGTSKTLPQNQIQFLNIVLGYTPLLKYETVGRNYFNPDQKGSVIDLGSGKSLWFGTFKSVRMGWFPMLNIDIANKPTYEKCSVFDFAKKVLEGNHRYNRGPPFNKQSFRHDKEAVEAELRDLKVRFNRPDGIKRDYTINKLVDSPRRLKMKTADGEYITIEEYFKRQYNYHLENTDLPCVHVHRTKEIYLPIELCDVKRQSAPLSKRYTDVQAGNMIRATAVSPAQRTQRITENMKAMNHFYQQDPYAKAFGISPDDQWIKIDDARQLAPPTLLYKIADQKSESKAEVQFCIKNDDPGKWNMGSQRDRNQYMFINGESLDRWGFLDLARLSKEETDIFIDALHEEGKRRGLTINNPEYGKGNIRDIQDIEKQFKSLNHLIKQKHGKKPQLVMIVCSEKGNFRSKIKYLGDAVLNIPTQFVMKRNVLPKVDRRQGPSNDRRRANSVVPRKNNSPDVQTIHNILLKINAKIGGINQTLWRPKDRPFLQNPVMFMGADVTHPSPGDMSNKPSIAAVVGSCDPNATMYNTEVRLQPRPEKGAVEKIEKMEEMTKALLLRFNAETSLWPLKIVFYRDGVGEGDFVELLNHELRAIKNACTSLESQVKGPYKPKITFLVVQKRHKNFPKPKYEKEGVGKEKNVPPGTVVDTMITHPTEMDFYMASQLAIKGTVKPAHYHVLWDDSQMSADELQRLTYDLCHLYSRCERSVSYPAPTYYAHLAAFRAREHHNGLIDATRNHTSAEVKQEEIDKMENMSIANYFM